MRIKKLICVLLAVLVFTGCMPVIASGEPEAKTLKVLFTHDIHSYFDVSRSETNAGVCEHGGAARLQTLLNENRDENTLYLDAGDFSIGTLLQAGYATDAYELRLLGRLGCDVTTFGNHEFDHTGTGTGQMLESALASGDRLPAMVQSNVVLDGELTGKQKELVDAMADYGVREYVILPVNGLRVGVFGLLGLDGIDCAPTSGMQFINYIEAAKATTQRLRQEGADVIVCLSHSGTKGDGRTGEDIDLAKAVPEIDLIISGHSHTAYAEPVIVGKTVIASAGEYLTNLGSVTLSVSASGTECTDYRLIRVDENVAEDAEVAALMREYRAHIEQTYLADADCAYDDVVCVSPFSFMPLSEMYATHQEYPLGNLIADSYLYEARRNGIDDIDVALVGLGTVRGSILEGPVTVADAFNICSLGVGADGSAGHPLISAWLTGRELKLLVELDASLGPLVSSIKMSYSGLRYTFNTKRLLLDRAYDIALTGEDGALTEIENDRLYRVVCNMYAANMLGMLNDLSRGILSITPKTADGRVIAPSEYYDFTLRDTQGRDIREWIAFKNYLGSFPQQDGVSVIPMRYAEPEGRKEKVSIGGWAAIKNPSPLYVIAAIVVLLIVALLVILPLTRKKRRARRAARKAARGK